MRIILLLRLIFMMSFFIISFPAYATLDIEISGAGLHQIPIAILPFEKEEKLVTSLSGIVTADLTRTGIFKLFNLDEKSSSEVDYHNLQKDIDVYVDNANINQADCIEKQFSLLDAIKQSKLVCLPHSKVPFAVEAKLTPSINSYMSNKTCLKDLLDSVFKFPYTPQEVNYSDWLGVDALTIGKVDLNSSNRFMVRWNLLDAARQTTLISFASSGKRSDIRMIAHGISDIIFEKLTGVSGNSRTKIAYILKSRATNNLVIADSDGIDEKIIFSTDNNIMSPAWSPDGSYMAFVSIESDHVLISLQSLITNQRSVFGDFSENTSAPAWSPNGRQIAFVLTREGSSNIFLAQPDGSGLQQITFGEEIDTEPSFSPDGQHLIFVSDRGGSVQIYQVSVDGGEAERLTFEGSDNYSPHYSPDGKSFVFSSWRDGKFFIATEEIQTKQMELLTDGGWERNPSFSPNGKMILYSTEENGHGVLRTVSIDGRVKQKMSTQKGDILDPMWGPQNTQ